MLSDEEKNKIRLEEVYRNEVKAQHKKSFFDFFEGPSKLIQVLAIVMGVTLSLFQYRTNSGNERKEAARDYQKNFYEASSIKTDYLKIKTPVLF